MTCLSLSARIVAFFTILLLGFLVISSTKLAIADIYARQSYQLLKSWQLSPFAMSDEEWTTIQHNLEQARKFDPENPELLMAAGLAHEGRFAFLGVQLPIASHKREKALDYYRQSVLLRPVWPYGWIDLALVKYRLGQVDQEFYDAIENAMVLGPWEPGVQKVTIEIGLHGWNRLNSETQTLVLDTIKKAVIHSNKAHVKYVVNLLIEYNVLYYACFSVDAGPYLENACKGIVTR